MEGADSLVREHRLARFACEFCREKKLKCSRELPKCNHCAPWPGSCEYARDKRSSSQQRLPADRAQGSTAAQGTIPLGEVTDRLQHLEYAVKTLTFSVERALEAISVAYQESGDALHPSTAARSVAKSKDTSNQELYIGPSHSFSFLNEAPSVIEKVAPTLTSALARDSAQSELQRLSSTLAIARGHSQAGAGAVEFHVPSKSVGYRMISQFLEQAELSEPFFRAPPEEVLRQAIFEPQMVKERAWVVLVNYVLLSAIPVEHDEHKEAAQLRRNTQLALNDSRIFLEPNEANIQALTMLAMHGEDYASPNLSWMLLGHACRQAQALGLHISTHQDSESRQQSLCLFWLLFQFDKSCSLAFGRPSFLPASLYSHVPLPDDSFMLKYHPHESTAFGNEQVPSTASKFGTAFLTRSLMLAKMSGCISDALSTNSLALTRQTMLPRLEVWYEETTHILTETIRAESGFLNARQQREMALGVDGVKFHYLHNLILLLKGDEIYSSLRLSTAREAISLLPSMVSNWSSVYNGVVWHLLYFPFIPFFVLFEDIISQRRKPVTTIESDLGLLSTTVTYFESMQSQVRNLATLCSRLHRTAEVFVHLARIHVTHSASATKSSNTRLPQSLPATEPSLTSSQTLWTSDSGKPPSALPDYLPAFGVEEPDIASYLDWLPPDIALSWPVCVPEQQYSASHESLTTESAAQPAGPRGTKRAAESAFDWFSWDAYYAEAKPSRSP